MIVESPTTHSNLDGPISAKFHGPVLGRARTTLSSSEHQSSEFRGVDDMIRQIHIFFYLERRHKAKELACLAVLRLVLRRN